MDREKIISIKESLTLENIETIVCSLGSSTPKKSGNNRIFQTICHGGDSYKLYYYEESKEFHCYTQCQDNFDIFELVSRVKGTNFIQSVIFVANYFSIDIEEQRPTGFVSKPKYIDDWDLIDKYSRLYERINSEPSNKERKTYSPHILNLFTNKYYEGWIQEGISLESMLKYNIKYRDSESEIIIPHYDMNSNLIGIRSRTLVKHKIEQGFKYMPTCINDIYYTHDTSNYLYGLNLNKEVIKKMGKIMLVEGEKSVLKCDTFYGKDNFTVGLSGSNLSRTQRNLILELGVKEAILALDKPSYEIYKDSEKYEKYIKNILKIGHTLSPFMTVYVLWDEGELLDYKDSPVDKGSHILELLMKNKQEIQSKEE